MLVVKKYANRRLYDTTASKYITLEDLAEQVRKGSDVLVQDVHSGADLTQATLTQIILESRGGARLLPVPLLLRLIRMGDEALAEFFGRYVSWSLETYLQAKQGAQSLLPLNPLAMAPFAATDKLARLVMGASDRLRKPGRQAREAAAAQARVEADAQANARARANAYDDANARANADVDANAYANDDANAYANAGADVEDAAEAGGKGLVGAEAYRRAPARVSNLAHSHAPPPVGASARVHAARPPSVPSFDPPPAPPGNPTFDEEAMDTMISLMAKMRAELTELKSQVNDQKPVAKKKKPAAKKR